MAKYLSSLQTQISRRPRQPVALTSLLRFRLEVDQSDILFCTEVYHKMPPIEQELLDHACIYALRVWGKGARMYFDP
jgi:hypothetical protein